MKNAFHFDSDYSASILSAFDISGSLLRNPAFLNAKGLAHDMIKLQGDLKTLENDYELAKAKAMEALTKDEQH